MLRIRPLRPTVPLAAVLLSALVAGCGGGGGGGSPPPVAGEVALTASRPGEVLEQVRRVLRERAAQRAGNQYVSDMPTLAPALAVAAAPASTSQLIRSDTLVQEAGIGEHDLIKSDGLWIYALDTATPSGTGQVVPRLSAWKRATDGTLAAPQRRPLPEADNRSPVIHGLQHAPGAARLAVLGESMGFAPPVDFCNGNAPCIQPLAMPVGMMGTPEVTVQLLDVAAGGIGGTLTRVAFDGRLLSSRLVGNALVLVSTHAPLLPVDALPAGTGAAEREAALAALTSADVLPRVRIDGGPARPLVADTDCYLQPANGSTALELTTITVVDLSQPGAALKSRCFVGGSEALYMATDALYLATTRYSYTTASSGGGGGVVIMSYPPQISTDIHKFGFDGGQARYLASGSVAGHLGWDPARKSYRLGEHDGLLRVLSFTGETGWARSDDAATRPPSPATLTVLRADTARGKLDVVSTLPNASRPQPLGHAGEQVHGVRFIGTRGYLVTFLRTDPLWVLDLADPADPKVAGELQVPGFSDHLYPLEGGLLLGVGRDADARGVVTGLKVSLFDVADAARPAERATLAFGGPGSVSALDTSPHGLNYLGVDSLVRAALPVMLTQPSGAPFGPWQHGLQRFEVDLAARTLVARPMVAPLKELGGYAVWDERSIQIGDHVYYLAGGELAAQPW